MGRIDLASALTLSSLVVQYSSTCKGTSGVLHITGSNNGEFFAVFNV